MHSNIRRFLTGSLLLALLVPTAAFAQESTRPERPAAEGMKDKPVSVIATAAELLGMERSELARLLAEGKSLADIAAANGSSGQALVDGLMAPANARLAEAVSSGRMTQTEADEKAASTRARFTRLVERARKGGSAIRRSATEKVRHHGFMLGKVAKVLGVTSDQLVSLLDQGQSLTTIAAGYGMSKEALLDALSAPVRDRLATAMAEGKIAAADSDKRLASLREKLALALDRTRPQPAAAA